MPRAAARRSVASDGPTLTQSADGMSAVISGRLLPVKPADVPGPVADRRAGQAGHQLLKENDDFQEVPTVKPVTLPVAKGEWFWHCKTCRMCWGASKGCKKCPDCDSTEITAEARGAAYDPDEDSEKIEQKKTKKTKGFKAKKWPSGLNSMGHPTWVCPACGAAKEQSVCPAACPTCGEPGNPNQAFFGHLTAKHFGTKPGAAAAYAGPEYFEVDTTLIFPSPHNPRKKFDPADLSELAESIKRHGLIQPIAVKPPNALGKFEIVAGERRWRACELADIPRVPVVIRDHDTKETRMLRIEENRHRVDLNAIEEALAFREALAGPPAMTQKELADQLGIEQGTVSNALRLLKAPEYFQELVIYGDMHPRTLRDLLKWEIVPGTLHAVAEDTKRKTGPFHNNFEWACAQKAESLSRPMNTTCGEVRCEFKATPAQLKDLKVVDIGGYKRALNVVLWDELNNAAKLKRLKREDKKNGGMPGHPALPADEEKAKAEKQEEQFARRLWRYKVRWLQGQCATRIASQGFDRFDLYRILLHLVNMRHDQRGLLESAVKKHGGKPKSWGWAGTDILAACLAMPSENFFAAARDAVADLVLVPCDVQRAPFTDNQIVELASFLKIDIAIWRLDQEYLELHNKEQLRTLLLDEWPPGARQPMPEFSAKRSELIEHMLNWSPLAPKELVKAKAP